MVLFTMFSGRTDSLTHALSLTDGQTRLQNASGTVFNGGELGEGIKILLAYTSSFAPPVH